MNQFISLEHVRHATEEETGPMPSRQHSRATATLETAEIQTLHEDELDGVSGGRKGGGGDVAMETIELAVETMRVQR